MVLPVMNQRGRMDVLSVAQGPGAVIHQHYRGRPIEQVGAAAEIVKLLLVFSAVPLLQYLEAGRR